MSDIIFSKSHMWIKDYDSIWYIGAIYIINHIAVSKVICEYISIVSYVENHTDATSLRRN